MNNEAILAMSRKENLGRDERELNEIQKAGNLSMAFGLVLCFAIHFLQLIFKKELDVISYACFAIFGGMSLVYCLLLLARLKKKLYWIAIAAYGFIFLGNFSLLIMEMVK
jgi:hypothetical protein